MNPEPTTKSGDGKLDFWISAVESSAKGHQKDLDSLLPILKKDPQEFIHGANQVNMRREAEYNSFFSTAQAEIEHRKGVLQREYSNQIVKPMGITDEQLALRQMLLRDPTVNLEAELKNGDALSQYLLRSPEFGLYLAKSRGMSPEKWYSLIALGAGVLEDKLRNAAFGLSGIPKLEASLKVARSRHEASLDAMHGEIKKAIAAATEGKEPAPEDSKPATYGSVKDIVENILKNYPTHRF
jgi:hypothetical protein